MRHKRGQLTLFLIIGIIILIAAGIIIFMLSQGTDSSDGFEVQTEKQPKRTADQQKMFSFIQSCFESVTDEALLLFGKQGGYIYKSQGGIDDDFAPGQEGIFYVAYDTCAGAPCHVPYWIKQSKIGACDSDFAICANAPEYPWRKFPYQDLDANEVIDTETEVATNAPVFGRVLAPPLYESEGAGAIEEKLKAYILNNINTCLDDFKQFSAEFDITVKDGSDAKVLLTKNDFRVTLTYPVEFIKDTVDFAFDDFHYKVNVRLKRLYDAIVAVAKKETQDATFAIAGDGVRVANSADEPSLEIFFLGGASGSNTAVINVLGGDRYSDEEKQELRTADGFVAYYYDDIIEVVDKQSKITPNGYVWRFVRQNRAPALEYIHEGIFGDEIDMSSEDDGDVIVADTDRTQKFEELWLNRVGTTFTGLEYYVSSAINPQIGHVVEFYKGIHNDRERAIIYVPSERIHINDDLDVYNALRTSTVNSLFDDPLPAGVYAYRTEIVAIDPDEEPVTYNVTGRNVNPRFDQRGYEIKQTDCCDGAIILRATAKDEAGLQDYQDVKLMINPHDTGTGACGYDNYLNCGSGDSPTLPPPPDGGSEAPKLNVVMVAINYDSLSDTEFLAEADALWDEIQADYGSSYELTLRRIIHPPFNGQPSCMTGNKLYQWVNGITIHQTFLDDADEYVVFGIDKKRNNEYAPSCPCNPTTIFTDNTVYANHFTTGYCSPLFDTIIEYYDAVRGNLFP